MPMDNTEIAALFNRLADLLELEDANPFRVRAYRNASRIVTGLSRSVADLVREGKDLTELPGIGRDLADKIETVVQTGKLPLLEEAEARTPPALTELMKIEGLGPKRVKALHEALNIQSIEDLKRAAASGKIRELPGFGQKTEELIRARVERYAAAEQRTKLRDAEAIAAPLVTYLKETPGLKEITIAGSFRRRRETVGDLDILVTVEAGSPIMQRFVAYEAVAEVMSQGETRSTVRLRSGIQVDLRAVPEESYGAALHYFTGSKAHNIAIRKIGVKKGLKINEYGVFRGEERIAGRTEEEVYRQVGLPYIPPDLREERGEIEAARKGKLPQLVTVEDMRGDLHCHTQASDGRNSLEEMARAAAERGYEYIAITDHSKHLTVANGLNEERLAQQIREIDKVNGRLKDIVILKSVELDILEDGSLDLPDAILKELDLRVCSVHYKFNLPAKKQTERILRAMDNPYFNVLAHPSGRLINEREAYDVDLERIMEAAKERGCFLEINAQPDRLDLNDIHCKMAKDMGVKVVISTDAHTTYDFAHLRYGIDQARRGWLTPEDVVNTRPLAELRKLLRRA